MAAIGSERSTVHCTNIALKCVVHLVGHIGFICRWIITIGREGHYLDWVCALVDSAIDFHTNAFIKVHLSNNAVGTTLRIVRVSGAFGDSSSRGVDYSAQGELWRTRFPLKGFSRSRRLITTLAGSRATWKYNICNVENIPAWKAFLDSYIYICRTFISLYIYSKM